jgi:hypothetical protein
MANSGAAVALDEGKAREALDRYRRHSLGWLAGGLVALVPGALLIAPMLEVNADVATGQVILANLTMAGAVLAIIIGGGGLSRAARIRRTLERHPWQRWASNFTQQKIGSYERNLLSLSPDASSPDPVVITAKLPSMLKATLSRSGLVGAREVDVAGDPATGPVVVRANGYDLLVPVPRGRPAGAPAR